MKGQSSFETLPPIVATKLKQPSSAPSLMPRELLINHINAASSAVRLVLVRAPAGFGKTTVMKEYHESLTKAGVSTAWLTMDSGDNDLSRFLPHLSRALQTLGISLGQTFSNWKTLKKDPGFSGMEPDLSEKLAMHDRPFVLFIDDFETVQNQAIPELVSLIVKFMPVRGQVVIGTRTMPALGLGRLRAHGHVLEITASELRFSLKESEYFMRQHLHIPLSDGNIAWLHKQTEGWIAALWLASLALRTSNNHQRFVEGYNGSNTLIMDYLLEDVLTGQPETVRNFLLETGILKDLSAPLCDWVTKRKDSRHMLAHMELSNLFLLRQDSQGHWYRYHKLFSDFLRTYLSRVSPEKPQVLHRRASEWYIAEGRPVPAIEHALLAKDYDASLKLLQTHAPELLCQGRVRLLASWFDILQPSIKRGAEASLLIIYAWALTFTHRHEDVRIQLDHLRNDIHDKDSTISKHIGAVQSFSFAVTDYIEEAHQGWESLSKRLDSSDGFFYDFFISSYAFCLIAASRFEEAKKILDEGKASCFRSGKMLNSTMGMCIEGTLNLVQGRLYSAESCYRVALNSRPPTQGRQASEAIGAPSYVPGTIAASSYLAEALYEMNQLDEAEHMLTTYLPILTEIAAPDQVITSYIILARIAFLNDDGDQATRLLNELESLGHMRALPRFTASANLERGRLALSQGDAKAARVYLKSALSAESFARFKHYVMLANDVETPEMLEHRINVRAGRPGEAIEPLKQTLKTAEKRCRFRPALKAKLLLAEALYGAGQTNLAMRHITEALELASTGGFKRAFLDEGPPTLRLVAIFKQQSRQEGENFRLPDSVIEFADHILNLGGFDVNEVAPNAADESNTTIEDLSDRERQVLLLLSDGHKNRTISTKLFISETTVKAHLRSIYAKLNASNRTHAISIARNIGLVP